MITGIPGKRHQQGVALLIFFMVLVAVGATIFLSSVNTHALEVREQEDLYYELEKAKLALISYAVNHHTFGFNNDGDASSDDEGPGRLPCPDIDDDGLTDSSSSDCTDYVRGRLPEYITYNTDDRFELSNAYVNSDQQFWYVVSPAFKEIVTTGVNGNSSGDLTIDGSSGYIAVIIAPGEALATQNRASSTTAVANYLEQDNVSGTDFINSYATDPDAFNDRVIGIKFSEIKDTMVKMAGQEISKQLKQYYASYYTYPSSANFQSYMDANAATWITGDPQEDWMGDIYYTRLYYPPSYNMGYFYFNSCTNIIFYLNYGSDLLTTDTAC